MYPSPVQVDKLCEGLFASDLLLVLLQRMRELEFEVGVLCLASHVEHGNGGAVQARKDVAQVWNYVLRQKGQQQNAIDYVQKHVEILQILVDG